MSVQPDDYQHHSIWTPECIDIDMPLAGVARRCMAMLVDQIVIGITIFAIWMIFIFGGAFFLGSLKGLHLFEGANRETAGIIALVFFLGVVGLTVLSYILYFWSFHTFGHGKTLGKRWLGIRLVTDRGGEPSGWTCFVRALFDTLDFLLFYGGVSVLMILMSSKEKRIADYAAGTLVILDK